MILNNANILLINNTNDIYIDGDDYDYDYDD